MSGPHGLHALVVAGEIWYNSNMQTKRELLKMAAVAARGGCAGPSRGRRVKFSANAALCGYNLPLLDQVKARADIVRDNDWSLQ